MIFPFTEQTPLNRLLWQAIQAGTNKAVEDTATGNPATFTTDLAKALTGLTIPFTPIQAGTGDPSPTNVRAISGFTGVNVYHSGEDTSEYDTYTVTFPNGQTIYGGTLDAVSGLLTVTHKFVDLTNQTGWIKSSSYPGGFYLNTQTFGIKPQTPFICSHAKSVTSVSAYVYGTCFCDSSVNIRIMESGAELTDWATYRTEQSQNGTPVCVCGELATPTTIQLDPVTIQTLIGNNTVWTDTNGTNTVKYLKKG